MVTRASVAINKRAHEERSQNSHGLNTDDADISCFIRVSSVFDPWLKVDRFIDRVMPWEVRAGLK